MSKVIWPLLCLVLAGPARADDALEDRLREAQARLDEAAGRVAELHREMYRAELADGRYGKRAVLGVLIDDRVVSLSAAGPDHPPGAGPDRGSGVTVSAVTPGGGAEAAGLAAGDVLLAIGDVRLDTPDVPDPAKRLLDYLGELEPGGTVTVEYLRDGAVAYAEVTTQAKHLHFIRTLVADFDALGAEIEAGLQPLQGLPQRIMQRLDHGLDHRTVIGGPLALEDLNPDLAEYFGVASGVLVIRAPGPDSELKGGDVLEALGGQPVGTAREALRWLATRDAPVAARVVRRGVAVDVTIDAGALARERRISIGHGPAFIELRQVTDEDAPALVPAPDAGEH